MVVEGLQAWSVGVNDIIAEDDISDTSEDDMSDTGGDEISEIFEDDGSLLTPPGEAERHLRFASVPCPLVRIANILLLQGHSCRVIRIDTHSQTGQHRYLGVDIFTRRLFEDSSFISNPLPELEVQTMFYLVHRTYSILYAVPDYSRASFLGLDVVNRLLTWNDSLELTAITKTGDIRRHLPVIDQGGLWTRICNALDSNSSRVRVYTVNDSDHELVVDYKIMPA
jgi:hypothetical protein